MLKLMPQDKTFFDLFDRMALNVHEGAEVLHDLLKDYTDVENKVKKLKGLEHQGDELTHHTLERLDKTFITPLEREDIHQLASRLDDVLDLIDTVANRIQLYKIRQPTKDAQDFGAVLVKATEILMEAVAALRHLKNPEGILRACIEIHTQENEGDRLQQHALATLFESSSDPVEIIKWKDIYEDLEMATDRCEDVANVLQTIVLKNT